MSSAGHLHLPNLLVVTWNSKVLWNAREREELFAGRALGPQCRHWSCEEHKKQEGILMSTFQPDLQAS